LQISDQGQPRAERLRQLVEKYLLGTINYSPTDLLASTLVGRHVEGLQCLAHQPDSAGILVVFPPGCSSCELSSYREELQRARQSAWAHNNEKDRWTLVFVNGSDAHTMAAAQNLGFEIGDVCAVREDALLDPYQTRKNPSTSPLLLKVTGEGVVEDVQELRSISDGGNP
jgi:hypothetical protein